MKRKSKREMVIEIYDREAMGEVTAQEIAKINQELIAEFGEGGAMAPAEIARVLTDEEIPVRYDQVFVMATPLEKYQRIFDGVLRFDSLAAAAASIRRIDELYRKFQRLGDRQGMRLARELALKGKRRAAGLAHQEKVGDRKRAEKAEIAQWFSVWLQTPSLFEQWLELRKAAPEFKREFASPPDHTDQRQGPAEEAAGEEKE
jgi:hypothetical protein